MELPEMMIIASRLQSRIDEGEFPDFATMIMSLTPADRQRLGEEYIDRTRVHRQSDKPRFIDKMPNNWQHVGLIRLILPNAKIIDARRHPMGCCFSGWKQHFARGQAFTYDLSEIGRYYRDYVALMSAFDAAAPGHVHRVHYEHMVADTPGEVARLLDYLGLPFEEACLAFWRTERAVRTASSEQVRQPIFTDGVDHWRHFAPWLGPLEEALGPEIAPYDPTDIGDRETHPMKIAPLFNAGNRPRMSAGMDDPFRHRIDSTRAIPIEGDAQYPVETARIAGLSVNIARRDNLNFCNPGPLHYRRKSRAVRQIDGPKTEIDQIDPRLDRQINRADQCPRTGAKRRMKDPDRQA